MSRIVIVIPVFRFSVATPSMETLLNQSRQHSATNFFNTRNISFPVLWVHTPSFSKTLLPQPHRAYAENSLKLKLIYDRQSVGQSVLVPGSHLGPMTIFLLSRWRFRASWYGVPSLTRGRVINLLLQLLLRLARAVTLCRSPAELTAIFYTLIWDSSTWRARSPCLYSTGKEWSALKNSHSFSTC
jgi:hypothetical protein